MKTLYTNANVLTMDPTMEGKKNSCVLTEDGIIVSLGNKEDYTLSKDIQVVDCQGNCLMPAFLDAHSHFSGVASGYLQIDCSSCTSFQDIQDAITAYLKKNSLKPDAFLMAKGYDHNFLKEKVHPTKQLLDACCQGHPCLLQHQSGHFGVCNSAAFAFFKITNSIQEENAEINFETGYCSEKFFVELVQKVPMNTLEEYLSAYQKAQDEYLSYGITTVQEGMMVPSMVPLYQALLAKNALKMDCVTYPEATQATAMEQAFPEAQEKYQGHVRFGGRKVILDGSPQGQTVWMKHPYGFPEETCGQPAMSMEDLLKICETCAADHKQLLAHANGDAAIRQFVDAVLATEKKDPSFRDVRPVIIHAQLLDINDLSDIKEAGMMPSYFVGHVYYWGDIHQKIFGRYRARFISPGKSTVEKGIPFTYHTDSPVVPMDLLRAVWCGVNRVTKDGVVLGKVEEGIGVMDALKAITINAAYQYHEESCKGSITVGKQANFVLLSNSPLEVDPMAIQEIQVLKTIIKDQVLYEK